MKRLVTTLLALVLATAAFGCGSNRDRELIEAMINRDAEAIHELLLDGVDPDTEYQGGNTPIIIAFDDVWIQTEMKMRDKKALDMVAPLICAGADFDHVNDAGRSANELARNVMRREQFDYIIHHARKSKYCRAAYSVYKD